MFGPVSISLQHLRLSVAVRDRAATDRIHSSRSGRAGALTITARSMHRGIRHLVRRLIRKAEFGLRLTVALPAFMKLLFANKATLDEPTMPSHAGSKGLSVTASILGL